MFEVWKPVTNINHPSIAFYSPKMLVGKHHIHGAKVFTPTGGTPARLDDNVNENIWAWGLGDVLVIAVAWLAPGPGAADDDVCLEGVAGAEILAGGGAETLEGTVGTRGRLAPLDSVKLRQHTKSLAR